MHIPHATYRLQFNEHFRLADALALVPYLHDLGISHLYASPLFKASPHSTHGYDVCDYNQLNPELGTEADLVALVEALHAKKMGLVLDIVPNHMGITSPENLWWWDILTHGEQSQYAPHFDIDWKPADEKLHGKILIPILGDEYEKLLSQGEFQLLFENDRHVLGYHEHRLPVVPNSAGKLPTDAVGLKMFNADLATLDKLIEAQNYHLVFHEHGDSRLNYRRFFAVSSLAAVRVEEDATFAATHTLLGQWLEKGYLDGLRVDHPDGLRNPEKYLRQLRALAPKAWIVTEKILEPEESLPAAWPVQGTTGYDFLIQLNGLFTDAGAQTALKELYASFTGVTTEYPALLLEKKRGVLKTLLAAELNRLTGLLTVVAAQNVEVKNIPRAELQAALAEVIVCFPVYRTYTAGSPSMEPADVVAIKSAVHLACEQRKDIPPGIFAFIHALLLQPQPTAEAQHFIARLQQLTGAVMAKGAEDTAFYCYHCFASLNEVGGNPGHFGPEPGQFHHFMQEQAKSWPYSQLTTSTHDTKRAEDVRARLNVLSEIPGLWAEAVQRWSAMNQCHRENKLPDRNLEYLYYQTLVGAWPLSEDRAQFYLEKASHEAKEYTQWSRRNVPYETAVKKFVSETLRDPEFTTDLEHFISRLTEAAAVNSLSQTLVKLTAPGVPDIYQGCELWDLSLVDPDNRRPVDFALRRSLLETATTQTAEAVWQERDAGLPKLWLIHKTLKLRAAIPDFADLNYEPVFAQGPRSEHVVAFSRGGKTLTVVPRCWLKLNHDWQDTVLELPAGNWRNEFSGEIFNGKIRLADLLQKFPVAWLVRKEND